MTRRAELQPPAKAKRGSPPSQLCLCRPQESGRPSARRLQQQCWRSDRFPCRPPSDPVHARDRPVRSDAGAATRPSQRQNQNAIRTRRLEAGAARRPRGARGGSRPAPVDTPVVATTTTFRSPRFGPRRTAVVLYWRRGRATPNAEVGHPEARRSQCPGSGWQRLSYPQRGVSPERPRPGQALLECGSGGRALRMWRWRLITCRQCRIGSFDRTNVRSEG